MAPKLDHLTIANSDRAAADAHYDCLLPLVGFTKLKPGIWTDGDGFYLQLITAKKGTSAYERYGAGLNHLGFSLPSKRAVEELRDALTGEGFDVPDLQDLGGATALFIPDPDGLRAEFTFYPDGMAPVG